MSFRTSRPVAPSRLDIIRRSCLQQDGLPFADILTAEHIEQAFDAEGVTFGDDADARGPSDFRDSRASDQQHPPYHSSHLPTNGSQPARTQPTR